MPSPKVEENVVKQVKGENEKLKNAEENAEKGKPINIEINLHVDINPIYFENSSSPTNSMY